MTQPHLSSTEGRSASSPVARTPWRLAARTAQLQGSVIRDLLPALDDPARRSLAGGLPAPEQFPVELIRDACDAVLREAPAQALQYASSAGHPPLREWVATELGRRGMRVGADQVLITNGAQQALDLVAKVLIERGSRVAVERPTYVGALQAFGLYRPSFVELACDAGGVLPDALTSASRGDDRPTLAYVLPTFQNPTGTLLDDARRDALVACAARAGVPLLEDDPYAALWYDVPPPATLAARWPEGVLYAGSFSKVLAPGLRLGYLVAPAALAPKLLQAKQAADLHTNEFVQRVAFAALQDARFGAHVEQSRALYRERRDAMADALRAHLPASCEWHAPSGGMFFWLRLPRGLDASSLLADALRANIAFVPGAAFHAHAPDTRTLRLCHVTLPPETLRDVAKVLGELIRARLNASFAPNAHSLEPTS